jgi:hypothetical protein
MDSRLQYEDKELGRQVEQYLRKKRWQSLKSACVTYAILGGLGYWGYTSLDETGYIEHTRAIDIYMTPNWLDGENRTCQGMAILDRNLHPSIFAVACPVGNTDGIAHNLPLRFYGKTTRTDLAIADVVTGNRFQWRCVRHDDTFTCYAIN